MVKHYDGLDNLRGYAAIVVMIFHLFYFPFSNSAFANKHIELKVLNILVPGNQSVLLFFVLSGFVLALSLSKNDNYLKFIVKRIFRIYPLYWFSIVLAYLIFHSDILVAERIVKSIGFNVIENTKFFINGVSLITSIFYPYDGSNYREGFPLNGPTWSLSSEMLISLYFPYLVRLIYLNKSWVFSVFIIFLQIIISILSEQYLNSPLHIAFYYQGFFILGAIIYKHRDYLVKHISHNIFIPIGWLLFAIGSCRDFFHIPYIITISHVTCAIGSSILIILCLSNTLFINLLKRAAIFNSGNTSYSIYLLHIPLAYFVYWLFNLIHVDSTGIFSIIQKIITVCLVFPVCNFTYKYIEYASIKLGSRILTQRN